MHTKILAILLLTAATTLAQNASTLPPTVSQKDNRIELAAVTEGTEPFKYQWYIGITPIPEGTQKVLTLNPPYKAGRYICIVTNSAGSCLSKSIEVEVTQEQSAPDMKIVVKQPSPIL